MERVCVPSPLVNLRLDLSPPSSRREKYFKTILFLNLFATNVSIV